MASLENDGASEEVISLYSLACGPNRCVKKFSACIINGVRFLTRERDNRRRSQNSGIVVEGNHGEEIIDFYGVLDEIIELDYINDIKIVHFKCQWFDLGKKKKTGIRKEGNIISVKVTGTWYKNDSFILADQARQVFYIDDPKLGSGWKVVQPFQHRYIYDIDEMSDQDMEIDELSVAQNEVYQENEVDYQPNISVNEIYSLQRENIDHNDVELFDGLENEIADEAEDIINLEETDEGDDTLLDYNDDVFTDDDDDDDVVDMNNGDDDDDDVNSDK